MASLGAVADSAAETSAGLPAPAAAAAPARTPGYAWYVAAMLSLAYLLSILDRYLLSVVLEDVRHGLALTDTQLGVLQGPSFVMMFLIASMPFGRLADIANRRTTIFGGLVCWSLATAACGMADSFTGLMLSRLMIGLGEAALIPCAMSMITAYFTRDKLSRGVSIFSMGGSFGRAVAFGGGGFLLTWFAARGGLSLPSLGLFAPWQAVFLSAGTIGMGFALLFLLTVREPPRMAPTGPRPSIRSGFVHVWRNRRAYFALFIPFGMTTGITALIAAWSVSFYVRDHGLDVATASSLVGATGLIFGPAGHLFGGWINDHLRLRGFEGAQPVVIAAVLVSSAIFSAVFALTPSVVVAAAAYGIAYFCLCTAGPTGFGGVQLPTPEDQRGVVSAIFLLVYNALGFGLGPLLVGLVGDYIVGDPKLLGQSITISLLMLVAVGLPFALGGRRAFAQAVRDQEARSAASRTQ